MDDRWKDNPGCWNAFVVSGRTHTERKRRLEQCPEKFRESVKRHAQMVYALGRR